MLVSDAHPDNIMGVRQPMEDLGFTNNQENAGLETRKVEYNKYQVTTN